MDMSLRFTDPIEAKVTNSTGEEEGGENVYKVECLSLTEIIERLNEANPLRRNAFGKLVVDFLSMDVEGSEIEVLNKFPFDDYDIRVVVIEASNPDFYSELESVFFRNGYQKVATLGGDWVFTKFPWNLLSNHNNTTITSKTE